MCDPEEVIRAAEEVAGILESRRVGGDGHRGRRCVAVHDKPRQPLTTVQEIEKASEALPLAEQLRLYRYLPHLIGCAPEELDWQRLAVEDFFRDDSPDDAVYDSIEGWGSGVRTTGLKAHSRNEAIQVP